MSKRTRTCSKRTICEVHRQLYDELIIGLKDDPELLAKVRPLLDEAFSLGISLVKKLVEYKQSLPAWEKNTDKEEVARVRKLAERLEFFSKHGLGE